MSDRNILQLAKQGDPQAIASLLNRHLQPRGINVKASLKDSCLQIMLEGMQVPDCQSATDFIYKGITKLGATSIQRVKIYGKQIDEEIPVWNEEFDLATPAASGVSSTDIQTVTAIQLITPTNLDIKIQPSPKELAKQRNIDAINDVLNRLLSSKQITAKAMLVDSCLQIFVQSAQVPSRNCTAIIRREILTIKVNYIKKIIIYGQKIGEEFPTWEQEFDINPIATSKSFNEAFNNPNKLNNTLKKIKLKRITILIFVLPIIGSIAFFGWIKFTQEQLISKAKLLSNNIDLGKLEQSTDIYELSVPQEKLQEAVIILEKINNIPGSSYSEAQANLSKIKLKLDTINRFVKSIEGLTTAKKIALEVNKLIEDAPHSVVIWQQAKDKIQQAISLLEGIPNNMRISSEAKQEINKYQEQYININKRLESEQKLALASPAIKPVLEQFSAVNSRLDVGMNYRDYATQVRELKVIIDKLAQQQGINDLPVYEDLQKAFKEYNFALDVWRYYIESQESNSFFPASSYYGRILIQEYKVETRDIIGRDYIYLNDALAKIWSKASVQIKQAQSEIN